MHNSTFILDFFLTFSYCYKFICIYIDTDIYRYYNDNSNNSNDDGDGGDDDNNVNRVVAMSRKSEIWEQIYLYIVYNPFFYLHFTHICTQCCKGVYIYLCIYIYIYIYTYYCFYLFIFYLFYI